MKPLTKTELKILVYNRVKRGIPYDEAVRQVNEELGTMDDIKKFEKAKQKALKK